MPRDGHCITDRWMCFRNSDAHSFTKVICNLKLYFSTAVGLLFFALSRYFIQGECCSLYSIWHLISSSRNIIYETSQSLSPSPTSFTSNEYSILPTLPIIYIHSQLRSWFGCFPSYVTSFPTFGVKNNNKKKKYCIVCINGHPLIARIDAIDVQTSLSESLSFKRKKKKNGLYYYFGIKIC